MALSYPEQRQIHLFSSSIACSFAATSSAVESNRFRHRFRPAAVDPPSLHSSFLLRHTNRVEQLMLHSQPCRALTPHIRLSLEQCLPGSAPLRPKTSHYLLLNREMMLSPARRPRPERRLAANITGQPETPNALPTQGFLNLSKGILFHCQSFLRPKVKLQPHSRAWKLAARQHKTPTGDQRHLTALPDGTHRQLTAVNGG